MAEIQHKWNPLIISSDNHTIWRFTNSKEIINPLKGCIKLQEQVEDWLVDHVGLRDYTLSENPASPNLWKIRHMFYLDAGTPIYFASMKHLLLFKLTWL